jgi:hypothetical protein
VRGVAAKIARISGRGFSMPDGDSEAGRRQPQSSQTRFLTIFTVVKILATDFFWRERLDNRNGQTRLDPARIMTPCRSPGMLAAWAEGIHPAKEAGEGRRTCRSVC